MDTEGGEEMAMKAIFEKRPRDLLVDVADLRKREPELMGSPETDSHFQLRGPGSEGEGRKQEDHLKGYKKQDWYTDEP